ncbi:MAG: hypothetical protein WCK86_23185 [Planctomycetia bacterium]
MQRILLITGLTGVLCLLGFFSARSISSGLEQRLIVPASTRINEKIRVADPATDQTPTETDRHPDISVANLETSAFPAEDPATPAFSLLSTTESPTPHQMTQVNLTSQNSGSSESGINSDEDLKKIRSLIVEVFPDADQTTVDAWTETLQGMSANEITEILQQKKAFSGSLDPLLTPSLKSSATSTFAASARFPAAAVTNDAVIRANLRNAWSVGYRRLVILPEAVTSSDSPLNVSGNTPSGRRFRCFDPGRRINSPVPLHVSLPDDSMLMFLLEGNILTRRGDFELLANRKIGLNTPSGPLAVEGSPEIPESAVRIHLNQQGQILVSSASDSPGTAAGTVSVVYLDHPEDLTSEDGVHFTEGQTAPYRRLTAEETLLHTRTLELSNVDPQGEHLQLQTLLPQP